MKKILPLILIVMLIPLISDITIAHSSNQIIYVDDEGDADYLTITDALKYTSSGDTIFVYSGNYDKTVVSINGIHLIGIPYEYKQGDDSGKPTVKRIYVYSNDVIVKNFKLIGQDTYPVIKIEKAENCSILNNTIYGEPKFYQGIYAIQSTEFSIKNNDLYHLNTGIYADRCGEFSICNNSFSDCTNHFISIVDTTDTKFSTISHNRIIDCRGSAIEYTLSKLIISHNILLDCKTAIDHYGINSFSEWRENQIHHNEFRNCDIGIDLSGMENSKDVPLITQNNFFDNQNDITFYQLAPLRYNKPTNPVIDNNYYDDSVGETAKVHKGKAVIMNIPIILPLFRPPFIFIFKIPISLPWVLIDRNPALMPFIINEGK
ncbi:MAG: right-handed parallel beta-helix repeat-containing protein [Candidatus Thermoplasmatota archaeon]|nr:right-handed parallel beta-helix repeat-containing protein [Candidatus Thermoplasmatota archaeon]